MMKAYYQSKKSTYRLPPPIYQKMVKTVEAYDFYKQLPPGSVPEAGRVLQAVDHALAVWVQEEYRQAVFLHVAQREPYFRLEKDYGISVSTLKRWTQKFVYGVARELGEDYAGLVEG